MKEKIPETIDIVLEGESGQKILEDIVDYAALEIFKETGKRHKSFEIEINISVSNIELAVGE